MIKMDILLSNFYQIIQNGYTEMYQKKRSKSIIFITTSFNWATLIKLLINIIKIKIFKNNIKFMYYNNNSMHFIIIIKIFRIFD